MARKRTKVGDGDAKKKTRKMFLPEVLYLAAVVRDQGKTLAAQARYRHELIEGVAAAMMAVPGRAEAVAEFAVRSGVHLSRGEKVEHATVQAARVPTVRPEIVLGAYALFCPDAKLPPCVRSGRRLLSPAAVEAARRIDALPADAQEQILAAIRKATGQA